MIELALSLFDYFIKLIEKKESNIDEYFEIYIQPAYEICEKIFSDYLNLLHTVEKKIQGGCTKGEIIDFLEDGRLKYLPLRRQLYADVQSRWQQSDLERLPKFEKGLLGILMGGLSPFATGYRYSTPYHSGHTLLDLMMRLEGKVLTSEEEFEAYKRTQYDNDYSIHEPDKSYYCSLIDKQIAALEHAWQDVVEGYAQYKSMVAIKPARIKKL